MKKNKIVVVLTIVLIALVTIVLFLGVSLKNKTTFVKPEFDKLSSNKIPENLNYTDSILKISEGYSIYIDAMPVTKRGYLTVNFISIDDNDIWIKVRVINEDNVVIAESGLVKPGEYLEKIKLLRNASKGDKISYIIMGYEKDTYLSAGLVNLNTRIGE